MPAAHYTWLLGDAVKLRHASLLIILG